MKYFIYWIVLIFGITVLVSSCANSDDSSTASTDNTNSSSDDPSTSDNSSSNTTSHSAPSDLAANGGANHIYLDWTAVSGASSYTVYWDNTSGISSSSTAITSISTNNYTHSNLNNSTTNYYKVAAVNSGGTGSLSSEVSATTNLPASRVVTMDNLTIGSQTYTYAWKASTCRVTRALDTSGDNISYTDVIKYYDNKSLITETLLFNDTSCTNAYTGTSIVTDIWGTLSNPYSTRLIGDNITVVQLSNYFDNGTAMPVFDNDSNSVDNGSMYGLIGNSDNVSRSGPLLMWGQVYPKSNNEVHADFGSWYSCVFTGSDNCTSPDNFTRIQDNVAGTNTLRLKKFSVMNKCTVAGQTLTYSLGLDRCSGTLTLSSIEDSHVSDGQVNTNFGSSSSLLIDADPTSYEIFIKSPEIDQIPSGATVNSATLVLTSFNSGSTAEAIQVVTAWDENSITWNNRPTDDAGQFTTFNTSSGTVSINVKAAVEAWISGASNHGIRLRSSGGDGSDYRSSEYSTANQRPSFVIDLSYNVNSHNRKMGGAIQGTALNLSTAVTTLAGSSQGSTNASGTSASFSEPWGITTDGTNLYVSDSGNHRIRKIVIDNGTVTTLAGSSSGNTDATGTSASFTNPWGITTDGTNLYVVDRGNHKIRKIVIDNGTVTTLAGSSEGSTDATGTSATFYRPKGITTDGTNLYVSDSGNHRIRKIVIDNGTVTTLAGSSSGNTDATGTSASFTNPWGITTDGTNLYVTDHDNHRIRKIVISTGAVTTLAGSSSGNIDATGTSASFSYPTGITTDGTNLYVSDQSNQWIRKIVISTGVVTTLAGSGSQGSTDATGPSASFKYPNGITTNGTNLYVADQSNHRIRKIE